MCSRKWFIIIINMVNGVGLVYNEKHIILWFIKILDLMNKNLNLTKIYGTIFCNQLWLLCMYIYNTKEMLV